LQPNSRFQVPGLKTTNFKKISSQEKPQISHLNLPTGTIRNFFAPGEKVVSGRYFQWVSSQTLDSKSAHTLDCLWKINRKLPGVTTTKYK
jgi:hypothetical protein